MQWYYEKDGGQAGPVEDGELGTLVRAGVIRGDTLVWRDGMRDWEPALRHVRGLAPGVVAGTGMGRNYAERVGMGEALRRFFLNYVNFRGRSNRGEYWWAVLALFLIGIGIAIIEFLMGVREAGAGPIGSIFGLATLLPNWSLGVRRLHDIDRTGWWIVAPVLPILLSFFFVPWQELASVTSATPRSEFEALMWVAFAPVMICGLLSILLGFLLIVWACFRPTPGPNRFG